MWSYKYRVEGDNHLPLESAIQNLNMITESSGLLQIHEVALSDVFLIKPQHILKTEGRLII